MRYSAGSRMRRTSPWRDCRRTWSSAYAPPKFPALPRRRPSGRWIGCEPLKGVASTLNHLALRFRSEPDPGLPCVSVVIRTKDRPHLLEEALGGLAIQAYPNLDVVVVNDGGASVAQQLERFRGALDIGLVDLAQAHGRSAAANIGIAKAREANGC